MVTLYTTHCPKCKILQTKLDSKGIKYDVVEDVDVMQEKGYMSMPMLEVDGQVLDFPTANKWVNEVSNEH